jgi:uncharacterized protein (TIGR03435 family)
MFLRSLIAIASLTIAATAAQPEVPADQAPTATPTFDVASIRENLSDHNGRSHIINSDHDGRFTTVNVPLGPTLQFAFGIPESQIDGIPSSLSSKKFDIEARSDPSIDAQLKSLPSDQAKAAKRRMIQTLLAERFKLESHTETRQLPIYNLVVSKNGTTLHPSKKSHAYNVRRNRFSDEGAPMAVLAEQLAEVLGRPVFDKTGLTAQYDINLSWTPDSAANPTSDSAGPDIFTAIQEQLGLKLEAAKGPVEILVVDHIEEPTPN